MTEAEELELLELEEAEALSLSSAAPERPRVKEGEAFVRGVAQGGTLGHADEAGGALNSIASLFRPDRVKLGAAFQPSPDDTPEQRALKQAALAEQAAQPSDYQLGRDANRRADNEAREQQRGMFMAGELVGGLAVPVPGGAAAAGATQGAKLLRAIGQGAGMGAAYGLGSSEAKSVGGMAADTALGGAFGAGAGALGRGIGAGIEKARGGAKNTIARAVAEETAKQTGKVEQAIKSAQGTYRSSIQSASRDLEVLERAATQAADPELAKQARAFLSSPEGQAVISQVARSKLGTAPERISEMAGNLGELQTKVASKEADIAAQTAEALSNPIKKQVLPRVATLGHRAIPVALTAGGALIGGTEGAMVGGGLGTAMALLQGRPGVIVKNLVKSPAVRKGAGETLLKLLGNEPRKLSPRAAQAANAIRHAPEKVGAAEVVFAGRDRQRDEEDVEETLAALLRRR